MADQSEDDANGGDASASDGRDPEDLGGTPLGDESGVYIPSDEGDAEGSGEAPIDFGGFLVSLGTNCMVNLGHVENPETGQSQVNLPAAKQTIEILQLLKHKTEGNLDPEEKNLLESLLHDTRLAYKEAAREHGEE